MDESLEAILDSLPPKPSRSKLAPFQEFIRELRRRGRSYQEITHILRDRCGVTTAVHSVYNFVRVREKAERKLRTRQNRRAGSAEPAKGGFLQPRPQDGNDAWKNIEKLKQRQSERPAEEKVFVYDENEPLKLVRGTGQSSPAKSRTKPAR
jgi:hypothetical protein